MMFMSFVNEAYYDPLVQMRKIQIDKIRERIKETSTDALERYVRFVDSVLKEMNPIKRLCYFFILDSYRYSEARESYV